MDFEPAAHASREKRRLGLALALALLGHGLGFFLLPAPLETPALDQEQPPLLVELREAPAPLLATPAPPQRAETKRPPRRRPASAPAAEPGPARPAPTPPTAKGVAEATPSGPVRLFDPQALAGSLKLPSGGADAGGGFGQQGNSPAEERARVSERIDGELADVQARARVSNGLVDPWFRKLASEFREAWHPSAASIDGSGEGAAGHLKSFLGHWQAAGEQYAATGSPFPAGERPTGPNVRPPDLKPGNGLSGFDPEDFRVRWNDGQFASTGALVLVRLEQDGTGAPLKVEILRSSGNAAMDDSARDAVRAVAGRSPAPSSGLGLGEPVIRTVWRFHARVVSNTCAPVLDQTGQGLGSLAGVVGIGCGGTFDLATGQAELQTPLARQVLASVELVALYGGARWPLDASDASGTR